MNNNLLKYWITGCGLILALLPGLVSASVTPGIYILVPPGKPIPEQVLSSPLVAGIVLRSNWQDLYADGSSLNVSFLESQLARIAEAGKAASLVVNNGGLNTPEAVLSQSTTLLSLKDQNRFHNTFNQQIRIPLFWDEKLIEQKKLLLKLLADKFAGHPSLQLLSVQCANATTDDWNVPPNIQWGETRFDADKLFFACKSVIDQAAALFPKTALRMAMGPIHPPLMEDRYALARRIYHYASQTYPERFYIQRHNLSANTPAPSETRRLMGWKMIYDARPFSAAQFIWPVSDTDSCRANGKQKPCAEKAVLSRISEIAAGYKLHYLEVYLSDFLNFGDSEEFRHLAQAVNGLPAQTLAERPVRPLVQSVEQKQVQSPAMGIPRANAATQGLPATVAVRQKTATSPLDSLPADDSWGDWVNPVAATDLPATVTHHTFDSKKLGHAVGYTLYLPDSRPDSPLPVIYFLHGKGGNETRGAYITQFLDSAIKNNIIRPAAMVMVNGGIHSFYSNSQNGKVPVEEMLLEELIPTVESSHPVSANPDLRMLEGFSMGGFGALKLAAKYPERFASVQTYGAALLSREFMPKKPDQNAFRNVFGNDASYFIENTPRYWLSKNADRIRERDLPIRMIVGSEDGTRRFNLAEHNHLRQLDIAHEYVQIEGVAHAPRMYYQADEFGSFAFHEQAMQMREKQLSP